MRLLRGIDGDSRLSDPGSESLGILRVQRQDFADLLIGGEKGKSARQSTAACCGSRVLWLTATSAAREMSTRVTPDVTVKRGAPAHSNSTKGWVDAIVDC